MEGLPEGWTVVVFASEEYGSLARFRVPKQPDPKKPDKKGFEWLPTFVHADTPEAAHQAALDHYKTMQEHFAAREEGKASRLAKLAQARAAKKEQA